MKSQDRYQMETHRLSMYITVLVLSPAYFPYSLMRSHAYIKWSIYNTNVGNFLYLCWFRLLWLVFCFYSSSWAIQIFANLIGKFKWALNFRFCDKEMILFINRLNDSNYSILIWFRVSYSHNQGFNVEADLIMI